MDLSELKVLNLRSSAVPEIFLTSPFASMPLIPPGISQSVTRSLLALFTPKENAAEFFGFLGIAGKALAFLGPLVFGTISQATGSQRPAILAIGAFFVIGAFLLSFVDEKRGKEAAKIPVDA